MNLKLRIKLRKVLVIVIAWTLVAFVIAVYDHLVFLSYYSLGPSEFYSLGQSLVFNLGAGLFASLVGGYFMVFYVDEKLRSKSYGYSILAVSLAFVVIVTIITLVTGFFFAPLVSGEPWSATVTSEAYVSYITNTIHLKNVLIWAIVVAVTQLLFQVSNKFGQGVLTAFILGRYRNPRYEERIFMFLDIRSSTRLAEKLGNERYHRLLKDFFSDITNSIIYNKGQVYQYVGDEVVISWKLEEGLDENHCVRCYFDIKAKIERERPKYLKSYQLVPEFKAGMHYGKVVAGEIGVVKRDITFSGDTLNTTARIQSKCNELQADFLVSRELADLLKPDPEYQLTPLGSVPLRGKAEEIDLRRLDLAL